MKKIIRWCLCFSAFAFSPLAADADQIHSELCNFGCPQHQFARNSNDLLIRPIYLLSSNDSTKLADWVAYRVTKETIGSTETRAWKADPILASDETLEPEDYKDANAVIKTDRGHQVPLASFTGTPHWELTNLLSNITPQTSDLNQGPWRLLEDAVRKLATSTDIDAVYVMTGPTYNRQMPDLPEADERHKVPSGYWKIVSIWDGSKIHFAAFEFDQYVARDADYCESQTGIKEVQKASGLRFFHGLDRFTKDERKEIFLPLSERLGC